MTGGRSCRGSFGGRSGHSGLKAPLGKVERANDHLLELQAEVRDFIAREPYRLLAEFDPKTSEHVISVEVVEAVPPRIIAVVGDLAHNLRSAFDYLATQLVIASDETPDAATEFPVFWEAEKYKAATGQRKIRGVAKEAVRLIERLQPYHAPDPAHHFLYVIHHLDRRDKHVDWTVVGAAMRAFSFGKAGQSFRVKNMVIDGGQPFISPLEDGTELYRVQFANPAQVDVDAEATFSVAFDKAGIGQGQPVVPACQQLIDITKRAIEQFAPFL